MEKITTAFEINNSALKGDLIIDENGEIRVIEIAARTSGGFDSQVRKPTSFAKDLSAILPVIFILQSDGISPTSRKTPLLASVSILPY